MPSASAVISSGGRWDAQPARTPWTPRAQGKYTPSSSKSATIHPPNVIYLEMPLSWPFDTMGLWADYQGGPERGKLWTLGALPGAWHLIQAMSPLTLSPLRSYLRPSIPCLVPSWEQDAAICTPCSSNPLPQLPSPSQPASKCLLAQAWWCTPIISVLKRLRQEDLSSRPGWTKE